MLLHVARIKRLDPNDIYQEEDSCLENTYLGCFEQLDPSSPDLPHGRRDGPFAGSASPMRDVHTSKSMALLWHWCGASQGDMVLSKAF